MKEKESILITISSYAAELTHEPGAVDASEGLGVDPQPAQAVQILLEVAGLFKALLVNLAITAFSLDPKCAVLFFAIIVRIGVSCTPSRADLSITGRFLPARPGLAASCRPLVP